MMRRVAGSVLIFEAIVIVLAIPVAINVSGVPAGPAIAAGLALAVAALVVAARVDRPGGVAAGWVVQALVLVSALVVPVMIVLGGMFAALWYGALRLVAATATPLDRPTQSDTTPPSGG
jgi:hypothetical protein